MKKIILIGTLASFALGVISSAFYGFFLNGLYLSLAITFLTIFYHFAMRVIVGSLVVIFRINKSEKDLSPFFLSKTEQRLYKTIKVKQWKKYAPTYSKKSFNIKNNSYKNIIHNMINAETGHTIIVVLSFLPLLLSKPLDGFVPFLITSVLAALFDLQFVIIQRYNRARLSRILRRNYGTKTLY